MAIRSSGYLQPSEETGAFGPGVYLTDLHPFEFFRNEILLNNYGGIKSEFHNRADWVVEILEKNLKMQLLRKVNVPGESDRRIFVYPYFILVKPDQIYDKPRCFKSFVIDEVDTSSDDTEDDYFETGGEGNCGDGLGKDENCYDDFENEESEDGYGEIGDEGNLSDELGIDESFDSSNEENGSDECGSDENGDGSYASGSEENGIDDLEPNENEDDSNDSEGEENGGDGIESSENGDGSYASVDGNYEDGDCYSYDDGDDDYCESGDGHYES